MDNTLKELNDDLDKISIAGYTNDDVTKVLQKVYNNVTIDRESSLEILNDLKLKIKDNDPAAIFLLEKANNVMDSINKQNDILVKLVGVMQKLQTNIITNMNKQTQFTAEDFTKVIDRLDSKNIYQLEQKVVNTEQKENI